MWSKPLRPQFVAALALLLLAPPASRTVDLPRDHDRGEVGFAEAVVDQPPTVTSARDGPWSAPETWDDGRVPASSDTVAIQHSVELDASADVAGIRVRAGGVLAFRPDASPTLSSRGNVIVGGSLRMRPASPRETHTLVFPDVREKVFQGHGEGPLATDVGLWVIAGGALDAQGAAKTPWSRSRGDIAEGATDLVVEDATGWQAGDEIVLGPTRPGDDRTAFEVLRVAAVDAAAGRIELESPTAHPHVSVDLPNGTTMHPEVLNLTRNVRIEGTPSGRAHVHLSVGEPQEIRHIAVRHVGVPVGGETDMGRYALHFHHGGDGTRGSVVEGVVARDVGTHAFVPHASHGITFRNTIAYDFDDIAYWWDRLDPDGTAPLTHEAVFEDCVAASGQVMGFMLQGPGNAMRRCVVYGIEPDAEGRHAGRGFGWSSVPTRGGTGFEPGDQVGYWEDGIAHHAAQLIWVWQNDSEEHEVIRPIAYHPLEGRTAALLHGAYRNVYHFRDGVLVGHPGMELHAASGQRRDDPSFRQVHQGMVYDAAGGPYAIIIKGHSLPGSTFGLIADCRIQGYTDAAVVVDDAGHDGGGEGAGYTFRHCVTEDGSDLGPEDIRIESLHPDSEICIQPREGPASMLRGGPDAAPTQVPSCP